MYLLAQTQNVIAFMRFSITSCFCVRRQLGWPVRIASSKNQTSGDVPLHHVRFQISQLGLPQGQLQIAH